MKYIALRTPCDAKDNIDIRDSNLQRQKNGRLYKFVQVQFFQVSLAASTNWRLKLNFYSISENKYNKFDLFLKKQKTGSFEAKTRGWKRSLKTRGFRLKWEGWNLCDIELPLRMFNSIFVVDVCLYVFSTWLLCCSILFF